MTPATDHPPRHRRRWTRDEQLAVLRLLRRRLTYREIAAAAGRTPAAVGQFVSDRRAEFGLPARHVPDDVSYHGPFRRRVLDVLAQSPLAVPSTDLALLCAPPGTRNPRQALHSVMACLLKAGRVAREYRVVTLPRSGSGRAGGEGRYRLACWRLVPPADQQPRSRP